MEVVGWSALLVAIGACCFLDKSLGDKIAATSRWVLMISATVALVSCGLIEFHVVALASHRTRSCAKTGSGSHSPLKVGDCQGALISVSPGKR